MKTAILIIAAGLSLYAQDAQPGGAGGGGGSGSGTVTSVTGTAPVVITSTPTTTPNVTVNGLASITGAVKANGAGTLTQAACADLSNAGTGCSGGAVPSGTGAVQVTSGVAGLVSGTSSNCVLVNGSTAPCDAPGQGPSSSVNSVTATNPSSATALQQLTLTTGLLNVAGNSGGTYNYQATGIYTVASLQTPTLTWALHACTVSACASGTDRTLFTIVTPAVVTATNNVWIIRAKIANTATGASGTLFAHGTATIELTAASDLGTPSNDSNTTSTAAIDLTGVVYLQLYVTASSSNSGNTVTNDQASLEPASAIGPTGPAGSGIGASEVSVSFSATPTFSCASATAGNATHFTVGSLTGNITSSTVSTCTAGQVIGFHFVQDATGGRTVVMPTNWDVLTLTPDASITTDVEYWYDGTNGRLTSVNGKATPFLLEIAPERAAPTGSVAYPSAKGALWFDSTAHALAFGSNGAGSPSIVAAAGIGTTASTTCTAPQVITAISAIAAPTCTSPMLTQNSQSAAYTTVLGDAGKMLYHPGADTTARTFTIDSNANVAYTIGSCITFVNDTSAGTLTIAITADTLALFPGGTTGSRTLSASNLATACKVGTTRWVITGSSGLT
jgi:hypothetical protein